MQYSNRLNMLEMCEYFLKIPNIFVFIYFGFYNIEFNLFRFVQKKKKNTRYFNYSFRCFAFFLNLFIVVKPPKYTHKLWMRWKNIYSFYDFFVLFVMLGLEWWWRYLHTFFNCSLQCYNERFLLFFFSVLFRLKKKFFPALSRPSTFKF